MKTCEEWSLEFDLLYNNIASDKAPGLTEYEKSVFLTRAQESVVVGLYKGAYGDSFESTEAQTAFLDSLVKQADCEKASDSGLPKISSLSQVFVNPGDLLFRTVESASIDSGCGAVPAEVVPVTQDEYWRTVANPFKGPTGKRVLRLSYSVSKESGGSLERERYAELVSKYPVEKYTVRYLSRPKPIILSDLSADGLSIEGETSRMTCLLPEETHQAVLTTAVGLAQSAWGS